MSSTFYQSGVQPRTKWMQIAIVVSAAVALTMGIAARSNALTNVSGCDFDNTAAGVWSLQADCTTSSIINVPAGTTLEGNGHTITSAFSKTDNDNNAAIGIVGADGVTINNLTVDGTGGTQLHGINVFESNGLTINDVTIQDMNRTGLVVNGSGVTVNNITTANNGWHGVNVDQGTGVTSPAVLTVNGTSTHNESAQIYVDNTLEQVTVIDAENQYVVSANAAKANDALYTLKAVPVVNGENFNTHSGADYQGVNVGFNVANFESLESVTVSLLDADGKVLVTNTGTQDLFDLYASGTVQFSTPFITSVGTYDVAGDTYWDFGAWTSRAMPVTAVVTVNGVVEEITPLTEPNGILFSSLVFATNDKEACKNNGWKIFSANYKNQGQCVAAIQSNQNSAVRR